LIAKLHPNIQAMPSATNQLLLSQLLLVLVLSIVLGVAVFVSHEEVQREEDGELQKYLHNKLDPTPLQRIAAHEHYTVAPVAVISSTEAPSLSSTDSPSLSSTDSPSLPSTDSPSLQSTNVPSLLSTDAPSLQSTPAPSLLPTSAPALDSTSALYLESTSALDLESTDAPSIQSTDDPSPQTKLPSPDSTPLSDSASALYLSSTDALDLESTDAPSPQTTSLFPESTPSLSDSTSEPLFSKPSDTPQSVTTAPQRIPPTPDELDPTGRYLIFDLYRGRFGNQILQMEWVYRVAAMTNRTLVFRAPHKEYDFVGLPFALYPGYTVWVRFTFSSVE
jgi:hypothetical protein